MSIKGSARIVSAPSASSPTGTTPVTPCECGLTDTFTRNTMDTWGTSDSGQLWTPNSGGVSGLIYTDGNAGVLHSNIEYVADVVPFWRTNYAQSRLDFPSNSEAIDFTIRVGVTSQSDFWQGLAFTTPQLTVSFNSPPYRTVSPPTTYIPAMMYASSYLADGTINYASTTGAEFNALSGPFYLRVYAGPTGFGVKTWSYGSAEPGSWALTGPCLGLSTFGYAQLLIGAQTTPDIIDVVGGSPVWSHNYSNWLTLSVDDLSIVGLDKCSAVQFDNFHRTVADGWGAATPSGKTWSLVSGDPGFAVGVSEPYGYIDGTAASPYTTLDLTAATGVTTFPITVNLVMLYGETWNSFQVALLNDSTDAGGNGIDSSVSGGTIHIYADASQYGTGTDTTDGTNTWVTAVPWDVYYNMRVEFTDAKTVKAKIWKMGSSEPNWQSTDSFSDQLSPFTPNYIRIRAYSSAYFELESIDFEYDARPCF